MNEQIQNVDLFGEPLSTRSGTDLITIKSRVIHLLTIYEQSRNNDNLLIYLYWREYDRCIDFADIIFATPPEVVRRCRQKINEQGLFHPTDPDVARKRRRRQQQFHNTMSI